MHSTKWKWYEVQVRTEYDTKEWVNCLSNIASMRAARFRSKSAARFFIGRKRLNPYEGREFRIIRVKRTVTK